MGNIGDDAILAGMRLAYPDLMAISPCDPGDGPWMTKEQFLREKVSGGQLIVGGGGLLHSQGNLTEHLGRLVSGCIARGMTVDMLGLGLEGPCSEDTIRAFLSMGRRVGLRSKLSLRLAAKLGIGAFFHQDFAALAVKSARPETNLGLRGCDLIIPRLDGPDGVNAMYKVYGECLAAGRNPEIVLHVARHKLDPSLSEEDVLLEAMGADAPPTYWVPRLWQDVLSAYSEARHVHTNRYHGALFAECLGIPWRPFGSGDKHQDVTLQ